ncbi:acetyl-CoA C-acyltransferase [Pseudactinotalea sp. HY160]|uniref:thiolase family protein n=1 Tax=Pseudactinotalea sp. HY160 TaxID=2654490 RepID=UPI00128E075F|nr:thiolase family protein [Pseudactinotalea sp. HY160]MPV49402.1 acetyl-CoA C-acyltransferase [Pseudactinotalea sp. HY160]
MLGRDVVLVDAVRSPFGRARPDGLFAHLRADDLIVAVVRDLLRRHPSLPRDALGEVAIAATTQAGDQAPTLGRTVALLSGLGSGIPGYAIDRMCAGAMTAATSTASSIAVGSIDAAIAGGVEHMGHHPLGSGIEPNPRFLTERILAPDALDMGATAENLHDTYPALTRERADAYAAASQHRYARALAEGNIRGDLVPIAAPDPERGWGVATADEPPRPGTTVAGMADLPTPFRAGGRVTAATSSPLTDGATAALLVAAERAEEWGLTPRMRLVSYAYAGVPPELMGLGPVPAATRALALAGLGIDDIGLIEINEAFAVQVLAFLDAFGLADDDPRVNPYGGAIAVGHPLAASGVRLMSQLARQFSHRPDVRYGMTTMCVGLGQGGAVVWENPHYGQERAS